jgi:hypothetical protein
MARAVDEIGSAVPLRRCRWVGRERLAVEIQQFPQTETAANIEREGEVVVAHLARDRRQRLQVSEKVAQIG